MSTHKKATKNGVPDGKQWITPYRPTNQPLRKSERGHMRFMSNAGG